VWDFVGAIIIHGIEVPVKSFKGLPSEICYPNMNHPPTIC
jgi:hypothetical protein